MHSAAGGTSQRLKPALATVCSRSRIPAPAPDTGPAVSAVAIIASTGSRPSAVSALGSRPQAPFGYASAHCCFAQSFETRRDQESAFRNRHTRRPIGGTHSTACRDYYVAVVLLVVDSLHRRHDSTSATSRCQFDWGRSLPWCR